MSRFGTASGDVPAGYGERKLGRRRRRQRGAARGEANEPAAAKVEQSPVAGNETLLFAANRASLLRPLGLVSFVQAGGWLLMLVNGPSLPT